MKVGQNIECQACGASGVIKRKNQSFLECEYCGATIVVGDVRIDQAVESVQTKSINVLFLMMMMCIALILLFWLVFQNMSKQTKIDLDGEVAGEHVAVVEVPTDPMSNHVVASQVVNHIPEVKEEMRESSKVLGDFISIESQVMGETINGGKYWVLGIKNNSEQPLSRPGVMLSMFDREGQRIEEQGGWSIREILEPGQSTFVLLFLSEVPADVDSQELKPFASKPNRFGSKQVDLLVGDFNVTIKNNLYEIIGDVVNQHSFDVKYVRLLAVAYDQDGKPIGMGNAFSTEKNIAPKQGSGYKVKIGTFLQGEPATWRVWAFGRVSSSTE